MPSLKDRIEKWKARKLYQKLGDIFFWLLLIAFIIPGPRKYVATAVNKVALYIRIPSIAKDKNTYQLNKEDFVWDIRDAEGVLLKPELLEGEVIFLNFWGTYCPPCIAEMPEIQRIYDEYGDRVKFILVSGEDHEKVSLFMDSRNYDLPVYFGGRNMPQALSVNSIPSTFIISRDGKIVTKKTGAADWDSRATRKIFNRLLPN